MSSRRALHPLRYIVYPHLVGGDIGCGMAVYRIDLDARFSVDRLAKKARGLDDAWVADLVDEGACRVDAILRPRLTYKTPVRGDGASEKITWKSKRRDAL